LAHWIPTGFGRVNRVRKGYIGKISFYAQDSGLVVYRIYKDRWYLRWLLKDKEALPPSIKALRGFLTYRTPTVRSKIIART
jgi:hypothetical protein